MTTIFRKKSLKNYTVFHKKEPRIFEYCISALQLLCIMDEWTNKMDLGAQVDAIYTDFAKAFIQSLIEGYCVN